ncbi:hypothetical protein ALC57_14433, partial [Trachymyrmex cornetzi]
TLVNRNTTLQVSRNSLRVIPSGKWIRVHIRLVEIIERKLKTKLLTTVNREKLENELEEVKEVLRRNEKELQNLRNENSKSFMIAACLIFVCFLIYGTYLLIFGNV